MPLRAALARWRDPLLLIGLLLLPFVVFVRQALVQTAFYKHDVQHYFYPLPYRASAVCRAGLCAALEPLCVQRHAAAGRWPDRAVLSAELAVLLSARRRGAELRCAAPVLDRRPGHVPVCAQPGARARAVPAWRGRLYVRRLSDRAGGSPLDHERRGADPAAVLLRRAGAAHPVAALVRGCGGERWRSRRSPATRRCLSIRRWRLACMCWCAPSSYGGSAADRRALYLLPCPARLHLYPRLWPGRDPAGALGRAGESVAARRRGQLRLCVQRVDGR